MNIFRGKLEQEVKMKYIRAFWWLFFSTIAFLILFVILISVGLFGKLPKTDEIENPKSPLASEVYSSDGKILGKYFNENRSPVSYDEISIHVINALIATEDIRFKKHSGIDWKSTSTIPLYLLIGKKKGASTISQQLAKNLFPRKRFDNIFVIVTRKLKEWIMAVKLERFYTKEEIVTMYLNTVEFGSNAYGIKAAAKTFFNKSPDSLKVEEAAVLIGLLKGTTLYNPINNPEAALNRRNTVLSQMEKANYLSGDQCDSLQKLPIKLQYAVESQNLGLARYFREELRLELKTWCEENGYDLYTSGLKIYTTIDSRMQKYAEEACWQHLSEHQKLFFEQMKGKKNAPFDARLSEKDIQKLMILAMKRTDRYYELKRNKYSWEEIWKNFHVPVKMKMFAFTGEYYDTLSPYDSIYYYKYFMNPGFMAMEPNTGYIKAWVGGIDYKYFKYDHVNEKAKRQVGSTFKPIVFTTAIKEGYSPCMKVPNVPVVFPEFNNWQPKNSDGEYGGEYTLKKGLAKSINCITAWVMKQVGPEAVVQMSKKLGITSKIDPFPSIALGTADISVYEMVGAFNTFNNNGMWIQPTYLVKICDKDGNVLREFVPREVEALDPAFNYVMVNMLEGVAMGGGTAVRLRFKYDIRGPLAGKTGTTQNNSDGWFIGFVPQLTAGCWVGWEDRSVHFRNMFYGQGASLALPIWAYFMKKVYADRTLGIKSDMAFKKPEGELPVEIDCSKYETPEEGEVIEGYVKRQPF